MIKVTNIALHELAPLNKTVHNVANAYWVLWYTAGAVLYTAGVTCKTLCTRRDVHVYTAIRPTTVLE